MISISTGSRASISTFGLYGDAQDVLGSSFDNPRFLSPGAPRAGWGGLRFHF